MEQKSHRSHVRGHHLSTVDIHTWEIDDQPVKEIPAQQRTIFMYEHVQNIPQESAQELQMQL